MADPFKPVSRFTPLGTSHGTSVTHDRGTADRFEPVSQPTPTEEQRSKWASHFNITDRKKPVEVDELADHTLFATNCTQHDTQHPEEPGDRPWRVFSPLCFSSSRPQTF
ncbi:hypothetical protein CONLIGDRAFT_102122 [Coniochaeta ligniaria NRRL 30616]|uniref:Uncharacterized protein n=1 Tax=Coniochaeta ligniaria NRRL 30616 TaxID=1408157 RepID=A0A1J7IB20_9PEZI|nr:hypothetical protein CONLIGDRAFT_102122 [Coniochaeta ligniaria NRRL 30616]